MYCTNNCIYNYRYTSSSMMCPSGGVPRLSVEEEKPTIFQSSTLHCVRIKLYLLCLTAEGTEGKM